jgi:hypothetical protein
MQVDGQGNDRWVASETSFLGGPFGHTFNCAYGTSFPTGSAIFLEGGGDDTYLTEATDPVRGSESMAEGWGYAGSALFWDVAGNDLHRMVARGPDSMVTGRGTVGFGAVGPSVSALYLDTGGVDTYADEPSDQTIGSDGGVWVAGIDVNAVPSV